MSELKKCLVCQKNVSLSEICPDCERILFSQRSSKEEETLVDSRPEIDTTHGQETFPIENIEANNRYQIIEEIGTGGMGKVHKVHDTLLKTTVAMKTILRQEESYVRRFIREVTLARRLNHPNIIRVHDMGQRNNQYFFTMDYIEGKTLRELINQNIDLPSLLKMFLQIAEAISYAHKEGVIHRDIKPENIVVDKNNTPIVMDFGLACSDGDETKLSRTGSPLGTAKYMSPEQVKGEREIDYCTDIYSLGALLYEILTGKPVFDHRGEIIYYHISYTKPLSPQKVNPRISKKLAQIVLKTLEKKKDNRYQNVDDFLVHLKNEIPQGFNVEKTKFPLAYKTALSLLLIFLIFGFSFFIYQRIFFPKSHQAPKDSPFILQMDEALTDHFRNCHTCRKRLNNVYNISPHEIGHPPHWIKQMDFAYEVSDHIQDILRSRDQKEIKLILDEHYLSCQTCKKTLRKKYKIEPQQIRRKPDWNRHQDFAKDVQKHIEEILNNGKKTDHDLLNHDPKSPQKTHEK